MLKIIHRFGKHCSCHLQGEYVLIGRFWNPYIRQTIGCEWYVTDLIGGAEEPAADKNYHTSPLQRSSAK
jgi:hypothetical protein